MLDKLTSAQTSEEKFNLTVINTAYKTGVFMVVIGILGILVPNIIGLSFNAFVGGLFLFASIPLA